MLKFLRNLPVIKQLADETQKITNSGFLKSAMGACALVANADGSIDDCEVAEVLKYADEHNIFGLYTASQVKTAFDEQVAQVQVSDQKVYDQIAELKGETAEASLLVNVAIAIGASDGDFDADEQKVVKKLIAVLGLKESDFFKDEA